MSRSGFRICWPEAWEAPNRRTRNRFDRLLGSPALWLGVADRWRGMGDKGPTIRECLAVARYKRLLATKRGDPRERFFTR